MTDSNVVLLQTLAPTVLIGGLALLAQWGRKRRGAEAALVVAVVALSAWALVSGVEAALSAVSGGGAYPPAFLAVKATVSAAIGTSGLSLCVARAAGAWRDRRRSGYLTRTEKAGLWNTSARKGEPNFLFRGALRFPSDPPVYFAAWLFVAALSIYLAQHAYFALAPEAAGEALQGQGRVAALDVALTQGPLLAAAVMGVGLGIRRGIKETLARLGYGPLSPKQVGVVALFVAAALAVGAATSALFAALQPELYGVFLRTDEALYGARDLTLAQAALFGLLMGVGSAVGEEALFRGAVQPVFGIFATSVLFASMHSPYGPSVAVLDLFLFSVGVGFLRRWANTSAAALAHASYLLVLAVIGHFAYGV